MPTVHFAPAPGRPRSSLDAERFPLPPSRERWLELLPLDHATLPLPAAFSREGDDLVVFRRRPPGRPIRDGRVPRDLVPQLLLQAAAALAFFRAFGFGLNEEDFALASWDRVDGCARLSLTRSPAALSSGGDPAPSEALAAFLDRLARRGGRFVDLEARALSRLLGEPEARSRRAESLLAGVFRSFPALSGRAAAPVRRRTAGWSGGFLRTIEARAVVASGRAALEGRSARLFWPRGSSLRGGSALGLDPPPSSSAEASRRLRELARADAARGRGAWIAAGVESWDALSRRAFETAAAFLPDEIEARRLPACETAPLLPDEWRREIFVACGSIAASLRFYEWLAEEARPNPHRGGELALEALASEEWGAFAADPTGQAPHPGRRGEALFLRPRGPASDAGAVRRAAERQSDPARRVEMFLEAGLDEEALAAAGAWRRESPRRPAEAWFELSARLSVVDLQKPAWLELVEAERQAAGGEPRGARALFGKVAESPAASPEQRRGARLRSAEIAVRVEGAAEAARLAAAWRRDFPRAPVEETLRALRLEAVGAAREGAHPRAHALLEEGDRLAEGAPEEERIENALARATALSLEGRFAEEAELYERWRRPALERSDALAARFVSAEALGLCDRRRYAEAAARLEEALRALRDDPAERSRLSIDLAATLYHAGRRDRCDALLEEAARLAATAGRADLLRLARSNAVELAIADGRWEAAASAVRELLRHAKQSGDALWQLVALHHRSRVALRRGELDRAAEDNRAARELAERLSDRLEVGELSLEEGDIRLYAGDVDGARQAWERAAADPPDRCDTERLAASRLRELAWRDSGGPTDAARAEVSAALARGDYAAAETVARWQALFGERSLAEELRTAAARVLRERGGGALADRLLGVRGAVLPVSSIPISALRELRETMAFALSGQDGAERLAALGLSGLALEDAEGKTVLRLGRLSGEESVRVLEAGAASYRLLLPRDAPEPLAAAAALLAETLLFRAPASLDPAGFVDGWRRLGIVTGDPSMEEPWRRLARFAAQSVTVLVRGDSGSGKEAVARAVHALSPRASGPFVAVNVPAIPAALLESELFGHVRGAFTGAERDRAGLLEEASLGTLFLDEIGDLAPQPAGEASPNAPGPGAPPPGRESDPPDRRAGGFGDVAGSDAGGRGGAVSRGSLLPPPRRRDRAAAPPPPRPRRAPPGAALPRGVRPRLRAGHAAPLARGGRGAPRALVAGQRPGAPERHGGGGGPRGPQRLDRPRPSAGSAPPRVGAILLVGHVPLPPRCAPKAHDLGGARAGGRQPGPRRAAARPLAPGAPISRGVARDRDGGRRRGKEGPGSHRIGAGADTLSAPVRPIGAPREKLPALLLLAACLIPFANGLSGGFTYDDKAIVRDDARIRSPSTLGQLFETSYFGGAPQTGTAYRPGLLLSFAVQWWIHGREAVPFHAVNVLLHAAATFLLWRLAIRLRFGGAAALAAALLFAVHPIHVEAVTSLVGRGETQAAVFVLLYLHLALRLGVDATAEGLRRARVSAALLLYLAALLTKESAAVAPALAFLVLARCAKGSPFARARDALSRGSALYAGSAAVLGGYLFLRRSVLGGWLKSGGGIFEVENPLAPLGAAARLGNAALLLLRYLGRLLLPLRLSADESAWQIRPVPAGSLAAIGAILLLALAAAAALARPRSAAAFGLLFFLLAILPASNLLFPIGTVFAERVAYLPSAGICIAGAALAGRAERLSAVSPVRLAALSALTLLYASRTAIRSTVWWSDETLFANSARVAPESAKNHYNLGYIRAERLHFREGRAAYGRATEIYPKYWDAWAGKGRCERDLGLLPEARRSYERALEAFPAYETGFFGLGLVFEAMGEDREALETYRRGLARNADSLPLLVRAATVASRLGSDSAEKDWDRVLAAHPRSLPARFGYARWLRLAGRIEESRRQLRRILAAAPLDAPALRLLAEEDADAGLPFGSALAREKVFRITRRSGDLARLLDASRASPAYARRFEILRPQLERAAPWAFPG